MRSAAYHFSVRCRSYTILQHVQVGKYYRTIDLCRKHFIKVQMASAFPSLLTSQFIAQECDATADATGTKAGLKI